MRALWIRRNKMKLARRHRPAFPPEKHPQAVPDRPAKAVSAIPAGEKPMQIGMVGTSASRVSLS
jgi:hypothetical protein